MIFVRMEIVIEKNTVAILARRRLRSASSEADAGGVRQRVALLPPDATGNFTKIVQRIPVKIVLDDGALAGLLHPGMSVEPTIDNKATALAQGGRRVGARSPMQVYEHYARS